MFPVRFTGNDLLNASRAWEQAGSPSSDEFAPIFVRNFVTPYMGVDGSLAYRARHREFILVEGEEAEISVGDGWEAKYGLCVNRAQWPNKPEDDLATLVAVDPTLPEKARKVVAESGDKASTERVREAVTEAMFATCSAQNVATGKRVESYGEIYFSESHGLACKVSVGWSHLPVPCRIEEVSDEKGADPGWKRCKVLYPVTDDEVQERHSYVSIHEDNLPKIDDERYARFVKDLTVAVETAKASATQDTGLPEFPTVQSLENGYPEAKLPREVTLECFAAAQLAWYSRGRRMLEGIGYTILGREARTGSGKTRQSKWGLAGKVGPQELCPHITRVDNERGILYAPRAKMGLVIGKGGETIQRIEKMTGKRWKVQPE